MWLVDVIYIPMYPCFMLDERRREIATSCLLITDIDEVSTLATRYILLHSAAWPSTDNWTNFLLEWSGCQCTWRGSKSMFRSTTCQRRNKFRCSSHSLEGISMAYSIRWWLQKARLVNPCPKSLRHLKRTRTYAGEHHHSPLYLTSQKSRSQQIYCRVHGWTLTISHTLQLRRLS